MEEVFADTGYWVAMQYAMDPLHQKARLVTQLLDSYRIVTSELVLVEFLNHVSKLGEYDRGQGVVALENIRSNPNMEIVPLTSQLFWDAVRLYSQRLDKQWSIVDCSSFLIMNNRGIQDVLAYDRDFRQAGFTALLRDD